MTDEMLNVWLGKYNELEKASDRYWGKMEKCEEDGRVERAIYFEQKMSEVEAERKGMVTALEIFGYTVQYQENEWVIVEK